MTEELHLEICRTIDRMESIGEKPTYRDAQDMLESIRFPPTQKLRATEMLRDMHGEMVRTGARPPWRRGLPIEWLWVMSPEGVKLYLRTLKYSPDMMTLPKRPLCFRGLPIMASWKQKALFKLHNTNRD